MTFSVGDCPDGLEAFDLEAVGRGEGLGVPSPRLGCLAALFVDMAVVRAVLVLLVIFDTRIVFPSVVAGSWMLHIMAGMDQKDCIL